MTLPRKQKLKGVHNEEDFHSLFPYRFHRVLSQVEQHGLSHIISWSPCGTLFKVHDTEAFAMKLMPKIGRFTLYRSFLRQLSLYKFERVKSGPQRGAYKHIYFRRHHGDLCRGVLKGTVFYPRSREAREQTAKKGAQRPEESMTATTLNCSDTWAAETQNVASSCLYEKAQPRFIQGHHQGGEIMHVDIFADAHNVKSFSQQDASSGQCVTVVDLSLWSMHKTHSSASHQARHQDEFDVLDEIIETFGVASAAEGISSLDPVMPLDGFRVSL